MVLAATTLLVLLGLSRVASPPASR
jgi:hypothetical protein